MKHFKFLAPVAIGLSMATLLFSCNSADEKKTEETTTDSTTVKAPEPPPAKPANLMMVTHKVANFGKWIVGYEAGDSMRLAYGLHNFVLARGVKDSNMVMVVVKMDDAAKAKEFAASPSLKDAMKKSGVVGMPTISYIDVQMMDETPNTASTRVMIKHKVKDWDAFRKAFDSHKQMRTDAALTDRVLGYEVGDNTNASIVLIVNDMKKAEDFMKSEDLKKKMEEAGVVGPPSFFYFTIAKKY
ncbi:MAG: hypothetical protein ABIR78_01030 [Ferruginibacter sp.]